MRRNIHFEHLSENHSTLHYLNIDINLVSGSHNGGTLLIPVESEVRYKSIPSPEWQQKEEVLRKMAVLNRKPAAAAAAKSVKETAKIMTDDTIV